MFFKKPTTQRTKMKKQSEWTTGFSLLLGLTAAVAAYVLWQQQKATGRPPRNAPQLQLDNPGTQADFPSTATESEVG